MNNKELVEIVSIIEAAFERNPNAQVGELVLKLRCNDTYKSALVELLFRMAGRDRR